MRTILSWILSPIGGALSAIALTFAWGGAITFIFAIIGLLRRRASWITLPMSLLVAGGAALVFRGSLWLTGQLATDDSVSTALFWVAALMFGLGGIASLRRLLADTWQQTNGARSSEETSTA